MKQRQLILGLLAALFLTLGGGTALADTTTAPTVPDTPNVSATLSSTCDDVASDQLTVSWTGDIYNPGEPYAAPVPTSYTVTGNVDTEPVTVDVPADGSAPQGYSLSWVMGPELGNTAFTVVANGAVGSSAPATATVTDQSCPHGGLPLGQVSAPNNGAKNDEFVFHIADHNGKKVTVTINGKRYRRVVKDGIFKIVVKDENGKKATKYTIKLNGIVKTVKVK